MSRIRSLALGLALSLALLAGMEGVCRGLGWGRFEPIDAEIADWDRQWSDDFYVLGPGPGVNADGLQDREHEIEKPAGQRRLVFLGDSVTFGYALARDLSYPALVAEQLAGRDPPWEVFNVALPGWSTRQARIAYERIARKYRPDQVVLGFCLNDVAELQNNLAAPPAELSLAYRHSNLVRALLRSDARQIASVRDLFLDPPPPSVVDAWRRTRTELDELAEAVRADGVRFAMVVFPFRFQLEPAAPEPRPQRALLRSGFELGIPALDLLPILRSEGPSAFLDASHLSERGARRAAQGIVESGLLSRSLESETF